MICRKMALLCKKNTTLVCERSVYKKSAEKAHFVRCGSMSSNENRNHQYPPLQANFLFSFFLSIAIRVTGFTPYHDPRCSALSAFCFFLLIFSFSIMVQLTPTEIDFAVNITYLKIRKKILKKHVNLVLDPHVFWRIPKRKKEIAQPDLANFLT